MQDNRDERPSGKSRRSRSGRKRKRKNRIYLCMAVLLGLVFFLGLGAVGTWLVMDYLGRRSLSVRQEAVPMQMQEAAPDGGQGEETLSSGELRYQGKTYVYNQELLTFLVLGIDKTGAVEGSDDLYQGGQADALFLALLNPRKEEITVIGVNRDTMTEIAVYDPNGLYAGQETAQIALAHAYGEGLEQSCENTVDAVSRLFYGLPIHGYCAMNMEVVNILNDAVGGVDVTIPASAAGADMEIDGERYKTGWAEGQQVHLMGNDAYTFIRYRDTEQAESADARLERQKTYLQAFIAKAKEAVLADLTLPLTLYQAVAPYMVTDITAQEAVYLAGQAVNYSFSPENLYTMQGEVRMGETFEEFYPDETALYELILQVFYEEKE